MVREHRRLRDEFLRRYAASEANVKDVALHRFLQQRGERALKNGAFNALRHGDPVPRRVVEAFVDYCMQATRADRVPDHTAVLYAFCVDHGLESRQRWNTETVVDAISEPAEPEGSGKRFDFDVLMQMARQTVHPARFVRPATDADELRQAVDWLYVELGRILAERALSTDEARALASARIGIDQDSYLEATLVRHAAEPWTVVISTERSGRPVGTCIAIPVSESCHQRILDQKLRPSLVTVEDMETPSRFVVVEGYAMVPRRGVRGFRDHSLILAQAGACQLARLLAIDDHVGPDRPMKLLTFEGSAETRARAEAFGFKGTGRFLQGTEIELMERELFMSNRGRRDAPIVASLYYLRGRLRG